MTPFKPAGYNSASPYLVVPDARATLRFLEAVFGAAEDIDPDVEGDGEADPDGTPCERLAAFDLVRVLVEHPEVQREHRENEQHEESPGKKFKKHG